MNLDLNIIIPTYGPPDAEGVRPVTGYVPGYHVNTTAADLAEHPELEPFVVTPSTMRRVWAGDDPDNPQWTVALKFEDEAAARAVMPDAWRDPEPPLTVAARDGDSFTWNDDIERWVHDVTGTWLTDDELDAQRQTPNPGA